MTLKECYEIIGGDYDDVMGRLRREELVKKFVLKFADDKSYDELCAAMSEKNSAEAFRAAHTIKGVCQNLSFSRLLVSASNLTESLRDKEISGESIDYFDELKKDHESIISAVEALKNSAGV